MARSKNPITEETKNESKKISKLAVKMKSDDASSEKKKRRKKPNTTTYNSYVHKIFRQYNTEVPVSRNAVKATSGICSNTLEKIAHQAKRLCEQKKKKTITEREIRAAVKLVLPSSIANNAISYGDEAVKKFTSFDKQ